MELSEKQAVVIQDKLLADLQGRKRRKRKIGRSPLYQRWDKQPIIYEFSFDIPAATKTKIKQAIKLWEDNTCVRFQQDGPNTDRIEFFDGGGCSSYVGKTGGTQVARNWFLTNACPGP